VREQGYYIPEPRGGFRDKGSFTDAEKSKLRPIAEVLAMLDGNAFFGIAGEDDWYVQYLPEAFATYEANGGDNGWAGRASFISQVRPA
jgi:hypothetical protein